MNISGTRKHFSSRKGSAVREGHRNNSNSVCTARVWGRGGLSVTSHGPLPLQFD